MNKTKKFISIAIPLILIAVISAFFFEVKLVLILLFSALLLAGYILYKEKIGQELIIAFLIAIAETSYYTYTYTTSNLMIGKINLFPLISWTFGLVVLREIYEKIKIKQRFLVSYLIYIAILFGLEYTGYYLLNIRLNSNFPSLLGLGIVHGPIGLKLFYVLAGAVYLMITDYLKVK